MQDQANRVTLQLHLPAVQKLQRQLPHLPRTNLSAATVNYTFGWSNSFLLLLKYTFPYTRGKL